MTAKKAKESFETESIIRWMRDHSDRVQHLDSYQRLMIDLRAKGPRETEDGVSFFDETVDQERLDEVVRSLMA